MPFTCPCCGFKTLTEQPPGTFEICPVCFWEDDFVQYDDPDFQGGANDVSLRQAQANFLRIGACEPRHVKDVRRPRADEPKDLGWRPLAQGETP